MRIKICGLTDAEDILPLANLGVEAVGLNFCATSPRRLEPDAAEHLIRAIPAHMLGVGVFANTPAAHVAEHATRLGLGTVQLHGDEPHDHVRLLHAAGLRVIKAFRLGDATHLAGLEHWLEAAVAADASPEAVLLDAAVPGQLGGTGRSVPDAIFTLIEARQPRWDQLLPGWRSWTWILAGGLTPENVGERLRRCPLPIAMVDTASGVESAPGRKDHYRVRAFVAAAQSHGRGLDPVPPQS